MADDTTDLSVTVQETKPESAKTDSEKQRASDDKIVLKAKKRFARCEDWESHFRGLFVEDDKFGHADSDNMYQWPNQLLIDRDLLQKPTLTINKTRVHCLQIINDAKQNKVGIVVHPTSNEATYEAAEVFEDVVRHIEYRSRAQQVYDSAMDKTVFCGYAVARVVTDYVIKDATDAKKADPTQLDNQELLIKLVRDPLTVYFDPDAKEADKSDGEFTFVFDDMPREKFDRDYPDEEGKIGAQSITGYDTWVSKDHIRVAEYWEKSHQKRTIVSVVKPDDGQRYAIDKDEVPPSVIRQWRKTPDMKYRERDADEVTIKCYKIAGDRIIDRYDWLGVYIPIVPMIGEETIIDGQMDRKGLVRYMKDPQRMYNYNSSAAVEFGALQTKTPFHGPAAAFEGLEEYYAAANVQNAAFIPYKHRDDDGNDIPRPEQLKPPQQSEVYLSGMKIAQEELMMASGMYQSQFGANENATSGKAIAERQRQGDNATYNYVDSQAIFVRQIGRILVDMIPRVYDTQRIMRIRGDDGMLRNIVIDPTAEQAVQKQEDAAKREATIIFNPNVGEYAVEADTGPSYATKRQEAWNAIVQILSQNKNLIPIIGDLLFTNGDFPGANEIAQRLRRLVPPQALSDQPNPTDQQMQQQLQEAMGVVENLNKMLKDKTAEINIKAFDALTKRLQAIGNAGPIVTPDQAQPLIAQVEQEMITGQPSPAQFGAPPSPPSNMMQQPPPQAPVNQLAGAQ